MTPDDLRKGLEGNIGCPGLTVPTEAGEIQNEIWYWRSVAGVVLIAFNVQCTPHVLNSDKLILQLY